MRTLFLSLCVLVCWSSSFAAAEDEFIMACRQSSGPAPDGSNLNGATVFLRVPGGGYYLATTARADVPLTFVSETTAKNESTEVYSALGCDFTFFLPIRQPGAGLVQCQNGVFATCINSVE